MTGFPMVPITCEEFDAHLGDFLEGGLDGSERQNAEAHLTGCSRCRGLVADLNEIRDEAARLPVLRPTHDLWNGIGKRIETPGIAIGERRPAWQSRVRLASAAVLLVAVTAAVTWKIANDRPLPAVASSDSVAQPGTDVTLASNRLARSYDVKIAEIRAILDRRAGSLDSSTMRVLAINLRVIDEAIERVRTALDSMPSNPLLSQKLERAYELKLNTLRQFAEMSTE
jgi:hypothetical protein